MHQITLSSLVQVMAWSHQAPSHYLNQCWLIIKGVLWHSPECNFTRSAWESMHSANERWRYNVTSSLIGLVHTQNDLYIPYRPVSWYMPLLSLLFCPYRVKNGGSFRKWNKMCYWPFWHRGFTMCVNPMWPYAHIIMDLGQHWIRFGSLPPINLNPYSVGTELSQFNYVNIMAADAMAPYVARTSAAMILTM